ncbi:Actin-regulating kinase [Komagataella phaffii CBS 7435]|uniref:non-specific serine/threonine protein kinase n=2 Tax=Komagataella phaffii TaxID=460519 RepID=C4R0R3_KOMPG|nr:Protein serine/threonine kinase [Komagataella phaffii GS115]AOA62999.1 GQ67_00503T0 [Komagataella phaffii]CAH2448393.1 Actin-regulating kinase [Komagataella phaffii CBS 7435]AOA67863.1 GQ68_00885T0 [Komagataella phaffii GS115]CAY69087.1 Protein serine/threonine kinase [Komagataella phaffii GS115]CCA38518.1 Actin-regulating kinase [Komagataella phaffii CBS 7435]
MASNPSITPPNAKLPPGTPLTVGTHSVTVIKYISAGGFSHVYTVECSPPFEGSSIACLKRVSVPDKAQLNILRAEVDAMRRLKGHKFIVSYIDSHASRMDNGVGYEVFVLMEYCANGTLIDFMNTRLHNKLKEDEVLKIMSDVSEGIAIMHSLQPPLVHRDIKIENVLISSDWTYKLCDFGSASSPLRPPKNIEEFKILQDDILRHTTPQYRSPEMLDLYRGHPINEKADMWALGIFLYKLCYYCTPFERFNPDHTPNYKAEEMAIVNGSFQFPDRPPFSPRLKNVISKLLVSDPQKRPHIYHLLEEICKMRNVPVPIENFYKQRKRISQPDVNVSKVLNLTTNVQNAPISTTSSRTSSEKRDKDPFAKLDKSRFISNSEASLKSHQHHHNKHKSIGSQASKFSGPSSSSSSSSSSESVPSLPPRRTLRPVSLYASDDFSSPKILDQEKRPSLEAANKIIDSVAKEQTIELSPGNKNHIDSNVDFLRGLSKSENLKSRRAQLTGEGLGHSKKSSIGGLKNLLTGGRDRERQDKWSSVAPSRSRTPTHENHYASRSTSSESLDLQTEESSKSKVKRSSSIQRRIKMLLNKPEDPAPHTAEGYGKYTEAERKNNNASRADNIIRNVSKSLEKAKTPPRIVPQKYSVVDPVKTAVPYSSSKKSEADNGQHHHKKPPPKPKKPEHLTTSLNLSKSKKVQNNSDVWDEFDEITDKELTDLQIDFHKRFPSSL